MPKQIDNCVKEMMSKGVQKSTAYAMCTAAMKKKAKQMMKGKPKKK